MEAILAALKSGQTLAVDKHDPYYGLINLRIYFAEDTGIVVSPDAEHHQSELQAQFYDLKEWSQIWQQWGLEACINSGDYFLS